MKEMRKEFWRYISLSMAGMLGSAGTILADAFFVSHRLGSGGLAAMNIAMCVFGLMNGTGLLFGMGGATRYALFAARGDRQGGKRVFTLSFAAALVLGLAYALVGLFFARPLARALGAEEAILEMCSAYLRTILLFAPAFGVNHLLMAFVRNDGEPGRAMAAMMTGSLANIFLDYLFLYPLDLGIFGAALATGAAALLGILISTGHFRRRKGNLGWGTLRFDRTELGRVTALGLSAFLTEVSWGVVLVVFNLLALQAAGTVGVAAYGVVVNLALTILAVINGISQGLQPLISRMYGRGEDGLARSLYRKGLLVTFTLGMFVLGTAVRFAPQLVHCFNREGDLFLQTLAEQGIRIYFVGFLFVGYNYLTAAYFSATEQPREAFFIAFFRGFAGITAAAWFLSRWLGMTGIWLAFPAAEFLTILLRRVGNRCARRKIWGQ